MARYWVFTRTWWRRNPAWPDGREPGAGRRTTLARHVPSEDEARRICAQYNATHKPGFLSRKAEYESEVVMNYFYAIAAVCAFALCVLIFGRRPRCPMCGGTGRFWDDRCPMCGGSGRV